MNELDRKKWMQLYQVAQDLFKVQEEVIEKLSIITIQLPAESHAHYVLFLQNSLLVFPGESALSGLFMLSEKEDMPSVQRIRYQHHLAAYLGNMEDVSDEGIDLMKQLNLPLQGPTVFFESSIPNLLPDILSIKEVKVMIDVLKQLKKLLEEVKDEAMMSSLSEEMTLVRSFNFEDGIWVNSVVPLQVQDQRVIKPKVKDEYLKKLQEAPSVQDVLEVDVAYTPIMAEAKEGHRQAIVRILLIADHHSKKILHQKLITLKDEPSDHMVSAIVNHSLEHGKARSWMVRDELLAEMLSSVASIGQIEIEVSQTLRAIDEYVEELIRSL